MPQPREVVVTGIGLISPIGLGWEAYCESLRTQRSGIREVSEFAAAGSMFRCCGIASDFDGKNYVQPRKALKVMSREIQTAYAAAALAVKHAGITPGTIDPDRFGVVLGSEMIYGEIDEIVDVYNRCSATGEFEYDQWGKQAMQSIYPLWMLKYLPNMPACHIGIAHNACGPTNTVTLGEPSGLIALSEGMSYIERGIADAVLVGATGSRVNQAALTFRDTHRNTKWTGDPTQAMKPFDARRDGFVNGEGAGVLLIEAREHAERRGAEIYARAAGVAVRFDARSPSPISGIAITQAIEGVLRGTGFAREQVGHVNAHGLSTPHDDRAEARAIRESLGDVPVTAPKSYIGNLGAGAGMVELAASILAIRTGEIPATLNYAEHDPDCPVAVVYGEGKRSEKRSAIVLNHSYSGQAAAALLTEP